MRHHHEPEEALIQPAHEDIAKRANQKFHERVLSRAKEDWYDSEDELLDELNPIVQDDCDEEGHILKNETVTFPVDEVVRAEDAQPETAA